MIYDRTESPVNLGNPGKCLKKNVTKRENWPRSEDDERSSGKRTVLVRSALSPKPSSREDR